MINDSHTMRKIAYGRLIQWQQEHTEPEKLPMNPCQTLELTQQHMILV